MGELQTCEAKSGTAAGCPTWVCKAFTMSASVTSPLSWMYLWQNSRNTSMNAASNSWFVYLQKTPYHGHSVCWPHLFARGARSVLFICMPSLSAEVPIGWGNCRGMGEAFPLELAKVYAQICPILTMLLQ